MATIYMISFVNVKETWDAKLTCRLAPVTLTFSFHLKENKCHVIIQFMSVNTHGL